ncbi:MAG TPA: copper resistance protein CopC [Streptosporangiaceae bacterium]|nr:copper resistance protein CopC [Streptosporangiaceae bacterium]
MVRRPAYLVAVLCSAALGVLVSASPADAHAVLVSSSPADGAVLKTAPARVSATFDEPVGVSSDSLRVFAPDGVRADTGGTVHGRNPDTITVVLQPGLGHGTYTVAWHVVSADSHHVQGAFTFSIGAPSRTVVSSANLQPPASLLVNVVFAVVRWLAFYCFALLSGALTFVVWCWPAGATRPAVLRLAMGAWLGLAASVLAAVLLQGVYGAGQGMGHLFWPDVLHATLYSRYGRALGVRLLLVVAALFAFTTTLSGLPGKGPRERATAGTVWLALTVALAATWSAADHAGTGMQVALAVPADIVHLTAMATWLGGLAMLVTIVLRHPQPPASKGLRGAGKRGDRNRADQLATAEAAQAVVRFSPVALSCVAAILVTGTYMAWRGIGTWGALTGTTYGLLLLAKIAGLCMLIGLGYLARRRIAEGLQEPIAAMRAQVVTVAATPARVKAGPPGARTAMVGVTRDGGQPDTARMGMTLRKLRWSVAAETVVAAAVLAVTAVLVNTPTGRDAYQPPANATVSFDTGGPGGSGSISLTVTPAGLGPNQFRLSVTGRNGKPYRPQQLEAGLWLPARNLGPLPVGLAPNGSGRYLGGPAVLSTAGRWQLRVTIRSDKFDEANVIIPFSVH